MILYMEFDIVIIGGGLVGASLAASLKPSGLSLALVESQSSLMRGNTPAGVDDWDSRIYAISPGSRSFLEQAGAWPLLDADRIAPVEMMRVFGDTGAELEFSAYQMGVAELACIVENRELQQALWQVLQHQ
jgi:2-octaprenylphenol hydroxylase